MGTPAGYDDRVNAMHLVAAGIVALVGGLIGRVVAMMILGREAPAERS
jgi:hypothetical protein